MTKRDKLLKYFLLGSALLGNSAVAIAQDLPEASASASPGLAATDASHHVPAANDDIVVTASKRGDESLQDIPMSVSAITGATLLRQGAVSYRDYLTSIPGVSYQSNGGFKDKIAIRGVADAIGSRTLQTTGIYIDEAPITEADSSLADIATYDLARVEVLRGPQGTLYGSSSMGGTVRLITNKPDLVTTSGEVNATASGVTHGNAGYSIDGFVNIPIVKDKLALRVTSGYRRTPGFIDNVALGQNDVNTGTSAYVRAQLRYKPNPDLNILLSYQRKTDDRNGNPDEDLGYAPYTQSRIAPESQHYTTSIYGLTVDYDLSFAHLTSASNYIDKEGVTVRDFVTDLPSVIAKGYTVAPQSSAGLSYFFPNKLFTQEVRLSSHEGNRLHWLIGGYYSSFRPHNLQTEALTGGQLANVNVYTSDTILRRTEIAGFGEIGYDFTPKLTATAGLRVFQIKSYNYNVSSGLLTGGNVGPELSSRDKSTQQKYNIQYKINENHQLYIQAAQGYRAGGPISAISKAACFPELAALGYASAPTKFGPDKLWSYEAGSKNSFFNHRLTVNASGYQINWQQIQLSENLVCGSQFTANAGDVRIRGGELEMTAHPFEGLALSGNVGYSNSQFQATNPLLRTVAGMPLPGVPAWNASASADYSYLISGNVMGYVRGDYAYVGGNRLNDLAGTPAPRLISQPSYSTVGARIGVRLDGWDAALYATNLFDTRGILATVFSGAHSYETITTPRTIGVNLIRSF